MNGCRCLGAWFGLALAVGLVFPVAATAAEAPVAASPTKPSAPVIASAHHLATEAGHRVLREGGNAFDAAVAVSATLGLVEPESSGIGGGGFFLLRRAADGHTVFVDARERAPAAATSA